MKVLVVYESMWGNTGQIARAVAHGAEEGLAGDGGVELLDVVQRAPTELGGVDLIVVGGPTHAFSMSRPSTRQDATTKGAPAGHESRGIREWLAGLPESDAAVATFDTKVAKVRRLPGSAAKKAAKEVRRHHLGRVVDEQSFYVDDMAGPLIDGELQRAEGWGRELVALVTAAPPRRL